MKLELKNLAPYLPYGLKILCRDMDVDYIREMSADIVMHKLRMSMVIYDDPKDRVFIPILRPLSDLAKEIEFGGEKFVPIKKLRKLHCWVGSEVNWIELAIQTPDDGERWEYNDFPYGVAVWLIEHHFDVFGLIEKGLAIDINTLRD